MADAGRVVPLYKGSWVSGTDYEVLDQVYYLGSTYAAKNNISNSSVDPNTDTTNWILVARGYLADTLSEITGVDNSGVLGTTGATVVTQTLIDEIADKVMTKLLPIANLVNNGDQTAEGSALDARYGKTLKDLYTGLNDNLGVLYQSSLESAIVVTSGTTYDVVGITVPAGKYIITGQVYVSDAVHTTQIYNHTSSTILKINRGYCAPVTFISEFSVETNLILRVVPNASATVPADGRFSYINAIRIK